LHEARPGLPINVPVQLQPPLQLPLQLQLGVAFQLPVERAVSPGLEADKVRRLSERSAA
jgi:hypothetical protein